MLWQAWIGCTGHLCSSKQVEAMAKCQVNSILQPYLHDHIHSEGHYYMSDKQAINFFYLKTRHYKPRNFTNKFVVYVWHFVAFYSLSVNFVVCVWHFVVFCSLSISHDTLIVAHSFGFLNVFKSCYLVLFLKRKLQKTKKKPVMRKTFCLISIQGEHFKT